MPTLDLKLFGGFSAELDGLKLHFRTDKLRALLVYLVMEPNRAHRRETLATLLWGELAHATALTNFRISLARLNDTLECWLVHKSAVQLESTRQAVALRLHSPDTLLLDVAEFDVLIGTSLAHNHSDPLECAKCAKRLRRAVALYRGDFLAGLTLRDAFAFDEWCALKRDQQYDQVWNALNALARYYAHQGNLVGAQTYAHRLRALDPLRDMGHRLVIELYLAQGDMARARAAYQNYARRMRDEHHASPAFTLAELRAHFKSLPPIRLDAARRDANRAS